MPEKAVGSLIITGEWPGAGQSTTAKLLAENLNYNRVYAGSLFRQFAYIWHQEKSHLSWAEFSEKIQSHQLQLSSYPFSENHFNEKVLHAFQHQIKADGTPEIWDKIIDRESLLAVHRPATVVEGKVGVLLDHTGLGTLEDIPHPVYKVLLVCPPEISAHRVIKRQIQNGEIPPMERNTSHYQDLVRETANEIINRHLRDWERYEKIYHLKRSDIYQPDIIQVFTTHKSPLSVVHAILNQVHLLPLPKA